MKTRDFKPLLMAIVFALFCLGSPVSGLRSAWADDWLDGANGYARGSEQAKLSGKPMMVYFYTDWCPYCRKFEKHTLSNPDVQKALSAFIKVRINPEKGTRENQLGDQYRIEGFPSVYFENPASGQATQEMTRALKSAKDFINAANEFSKVTHPAKLEKAAAPAAAVVPVQPASVLPAVTNEQTLYLKSGRTIDGKVVSEDSKGITFATSELGKVYFSRGEILKIEKEKQ